MFRNRKKIQSSTSVPRLKEYRLGVFGAKGAGKSSLVVRFIASIYVEAYDSIIEDSYCKKCKLEGEDVIMDVLDTTYEIEYLSAPRIIARICEGFLFAYSINDRESFEGMKTWANTLLRLRGESAPVMVVGTKCDQELDREVTAQEGHEFATKLHGLHIETSAKLDVNVEAAFMDLAKLIKKRKNEQDQSTQPMQPAPPNDSSDTESNCRCIIAQRKCLC